LEGAGVEDENEGGGEEGVLVLLEAEGEGGGICVCELVFWFGGNWVREGFRAEDMVDDFWRGRKTSPLAERDVVEIE
jgi:hypothetical protein